MKYLLLFAGLAIGLFKIVDALKAPVVSDDQTEEIEDKPKSKSKRSMRDSSARIPASRNGAIPFEPSSLGPRNQVADRQIPFESDAPSSGESSSSSGGESFGSTQSSASAPTPYVPYNGRSFASAASATSGKTGTTATTGSTSTGFGGSGMISGMLIPPKTVPVAAPASSTTTTTTSSGGSSTVIIQACSSSLDNGTYKKPQTVTISCPSSTSIHYCLQEGSCCDPVSSGTTYTGAIPVGNQEASYCLRFYGKTNNTSTAVVQKNYTFNPDAPHLTATYTKTHFQTTTLNKLAIITSSDFGNDEFKVGQINSQNINPTALPQTCGEFVESIATIAPTHIDMLASTNMGSYDISEQVEIFLRRPELSYGNNYLTSYAIHVNYVEKFACSTTNVVLQDFEYFTQEPMIGESESATVREFSGGFSSIGYFEPGITEIPVNRLPAGSNSESTSTQELESGLFGLFF